VERGQSKLGVRAGARYGDTLLVIPMLLVCVFYSDSGYVGWCSTLVVVAEATITEAVAVGAALTVIMMTMMMMMTSTTTTTMQQKQHEQKQQQHTTVTHFGI